MILCLGGRGVSFGLRFVRLCWRISLLMSECLTFLLSFDCFYFFFVFFLELGGGGFFLLLGGWGALLCFLTRP